MNSDWVYVYPAPVDPLNEIENVFFNKKLNATCHHAITSTRITAAARNFAADRVGELHHYVIYPNEYLRDVIQIISNVTEGRFHTTRGGGSGSSYILNEEYP